MSYTTINPDSRPDYRELIAPIPAAVWPEFMRQDPVSDQYWEGLFSRFPVYQFALTESESGHIVALANSVPLAWSGDPATLPEEGWDWALIQSAADHEAGRVSHTLCGIQIAIVPSYQGRGLSKLMVRAMRDLAFERGLGQLIIPVRPSLKSRYPLTSIDNYITWSNESSLPFDPWLRVHVRAGGRIVKPCHLAMRISGTVADWESWTRMRFPESGRYVIDGALNPIEIDLEGDAGLYVEPNVWVEHPLGVQSS